MKTLDSGFAAHIAQGVTTLCWCWKITRSDAVVQGFTDHDRDVTFGGVTYAAATGFTASEVQSLTGLQADNLTLTGALSSDDLNEDDLAAGIYDGAPIEIWRANWSDPSQNVLMHAGTLGQVARGKVAFQADILGLAQQLQMPVGRVFGYLCDADLGDGRCSPAGEVDLTSSTYKGTGAVANASDNRTFSASGLGAYADSFFAAGKLTWTSGANEGRAMEIKQHGVSASIVSLQLWQSMAATVANGDGFVCTAGCDKTFATCKAKFNNAKNFQGFPYIGNDGIMSYPSTNEDMDGTSRYGN